MMLSVSVLRVLNDLDTFYPGSHLPSIVIISWSETVYFGNETFGFCGKALKYLSHFFL